jgi:hypothetical protein
MNSSAPKRFTSVLASLLLIATVTQTAVTRQTARLPNPVTYFVGQEFFTASGKQFIRYNFMVENFNAYPNEMFAAAPDLPPCGNNTKSARTWVDIYDQSGKRLNGFCALGKPADLNQIWFALAPDVIPPSWVYIELTDRKTNTKYKSNLAETTL